MARSYIVNVNIDDPTNAVWFQKTGVRGTNQYFPDRIYGEASFDLTVKFWHGDVDSAGNPEVGTTPANFQAGDALDLYGRIEDQPSGVAELLLASGTFTQGDNECLFDVNAGVVPNEWSRVDLDTTSKYPIAIWFTGTHEGDEITAKSNVIVVDKEHVGTGDALILDASNLTYTPATPANWVVVPTLMNEGLDELADRVQTIEDNPSAGDMQKAVYDPQVIESDAFDRNNMTGSQLASTISDFDTAVSTNASVTGSVTIHSDVSDAGAGIIPSSQTNANIVNNTAHVASSSNPHNVTPAQVGNTTAQWNANQIHDLDLPIPQGATDDDKVLTYDDATTSWVLATQAGAGTGENNDLALDAGATGQNIRVTKSGSDIIIKGILGANNATVSTIGSDIVIDVIDSAENARGAIAIANSATVDAGLDNTQAVTSLRLQSKLTDYQPKTPEVKTTTGAYTLVASDLGKLVIVDGVLDLPSLPAGYNVFVYNTSVSAVGLSASGGVTIDNTTNTSISAKGSISVFYLDATTVIVDGNTEV
jgi:hypothetical protein